MLTGVAVRGVLAAAKNVSSKIVRFQRPVVSSTTIPRSYVQNLSLRLRNTQLGKVCQSSRGDIAVVNNSFNPAWNSVVLGPQLLQRGYLHTKWLRTHKLASLNRNLQRTNHRNYCKESASEKSTMPPPASVTKPSVPEGVKVEGPSLEKFVPEPAKYERYGTMLRNRLKSLPATLKRFVGFHGPMTLDKLLPVFNLMFVGASLGVLVFTTSAVSLGIWVVNRNDHWKELTAKKLGAYLTYQTGISIEYESMSASWKEGRINLKNVKIVREPATFPPGESRNVTAMNLKVTNLTVGVSLLWMLQGNGILKHLEADGVTGYVDQRHLDWTGWVPTKRVWQRGDFFLDSFRLSNVQISLFMIAPDRELKIQIHSVDCDKLRKQWLLHDLLSAKSAYGIFDGSLFSLTRLPPLPAYARYDQQSRIASHSALPAPSTPAVSSTSYSWFWGDEEDDWDYHHQGVRSSLKIDGVNADLISTSSSGPISWITEGTIDIDIDLEFLAEYWEEGWHYHLDTNTQSGYYSHETVVERDPLLLDIKLKLNNLRADIPISTGELTLINKALVLPVVAYMNTNYTCIPLAFPVHMSKEQFNGAWSPWEAGLFEAVSAGCAQQFLTLVKEQQSSTNIQKHILMVIKSLHRGMYFLRQQLQGYYSLWYFNNDDHPEDLYAL